MSRHRRKYWTCAICIRLLSSLRLWMFKNSSEIDFTKIYTRLCGIKTHVLLCIKCVCPVMNPTWNRDLGAKVFFAVKKFNFFISWVESGGKWTVQKGESGRSRKWTVRRKWTVHLKVDGPGLKWTVFWRKVDGPSESGRSFNEKWTVPG